MPCCRRRQWRGYRPPAEPPAPAPGTWGDPPPMPSVLAQAARRRRRRSAVRGRGPRQRPQGPPGGGAGAARAGVHGARLVSFTGLHADAEKPPQFNYLRHRID